MSWKDRDGVWQTTLRKQMRNATLQVAACAVVASGIITLILVGAVRTIGAVTRQIGGGGSFDWGFFWSASFGPAFFLLAPLVAIGWMRRRTNRILSLVPAHDGRVCPRCAQVLIEAEPRHRCERCGRTFADAELVEFWEQSVSAPKSAGATRAWQVTPSAPVAKPRRRRLRSMLTGLPLMIGLVIVFWLLDWRGLAIGCFIGGVLMYPVFAGVAKTIQYRRLGTERCAKCGHLKPPDRAASRVCTECGTDWSSPGGTVRDAKMTRRARGWAAFSVAAIAFVLFVMVAIPWSGRLPASVIRALPTSIVLDKVARSSFAPNWWAELNQRPLTARQHAKLCDRLIEARRRGLCSRQGREWMMQQIIDGTLDDEITAAFLGADEVELDGPRKLARGERGIVRARVPESVRIDLKAVVVVFVGGFRVDGERRTAPLGRPHSGFHVHRGKGAPLAIECEGTGASQTVEFTAWVVCAPMSVTSRAVEWNDDGTPVIPSDAHWSTRVDRELVIPADR
jgi:hypothetical protein